MHGPLVLGQTYPEFRENTSGRDNEVQSVDADRFSTLLSRVFCECKRVMKSHAKLSFSFHHSKPSGWIAIAKALIKADLYIEEVFPVHAELMKSTPKARMKEPISLDNILICSKEKPEAQLKSEYLKLAMEYIWLFKQNGKELSASDLFVIKAAQITAFGVNNRMSDIEIIDALQNLDEE